MLDFAQEFNSRRDETGEFANHGKYSTKIRYTTQQNSDSGLYIRLRSGTFVHNDTKVPYETCYMFKEWMCCVLDDVFHIYPVALIKDTSKDEVAHIIAGAIKKRIIGKGAAHV
jgi:hypothetical protein